MEIGKSTHLGNVRKINEDSFLVEKRDGFVLLIIADGMGGHNAGEVASKMAAESIKEYLFSSQEEEKDKALESALLYANKAIFDGADKHKRHRGMGTTATASVIIDDKAYIANVGDSRAYKYSKGELKQITKDHSYVQMLVDQKVLTKEEARFHPRRNLITRALGTSDDIEVDIFSCDFLDGDTILLCTDGLTSHVEDEFINTVIGSKRSVEEKISVLENEALKQGGSDNITIVIAEKKAF